MSVEKPRIDAGKTKHDPAALMSLPLIKDWLEEASYEKENPWFLTSRHDRERRLSVLLYGSLRRSAAMLHISAVLLKSWWRRPLEPVTPSNGSNLVFSALGGVSKPIFWIASVAIAGVVGSEYATSSFNVASSEHLAVWLGLALGFVVFAALYQWWRFLDRLRRVLFEWVKESDEVSASARREKDIALFGYTFEDDFRIRFKSKGVRFLAVLTFCGFMYVAYGLGHH